MHRRLISVLRLSLLGVIITGLLFRPQGFAYAATSLSVTPITWNMIGLDSNNVNVGPNHFPIGARACNTSTAGETLTNVTGTFNWDSSNNYIYLRPGTKSTLSVNSLAAGSCTDFYFEVEVNRNAAAYDTTRQYHISVTANGGTVSASTPSPRVLYVEHLISQNRNTVSDMRFGTSLGSLTSVPNGGTMTLMVGSTYYIQLVGATATQGYEQIESFVNFPNTIFQVLSVDTTYTAESSTTLNPPYDKLYGDGCNWENDPSSVNYRACLSTGKAGGNITVTYQLRILQVPAAPLVNPEPLSTLIYDFSGSSFHYNSDFGTSTRFAYIVSPATIAKAFSPSTISANGTSTLTFTINNTGTSTLSRVNFADTTGWPSGMAVSNTTVATNDNCGSPTPSSLTIGATSVSFSNITLLAGGTCTISISVTAPVDGSYTNTTQNLFLDTLDTGNRASATLLVSSLPSPPTSCTTSTPLATWSFENYPASTNTNNGPFNYSSKQADVSGASTFATYGSGGGGPGSSSAILNSTTFPAGWSAPDADNTTTSWGIFNGWPTTGSAPTGATLPYFQFQVDASQYGGLGFVGSYNMDGNWSNGDNWYVLFSTNGTTWTSVNTAAWNKQNGWKTDAITASPTAGSGYGTVYFRVVFSGAQYTGGGAGSSTALAFLDDVRITGCPRPTPPTLSKSFSPVSIGSDSTDPTTNTSINYSTLTFAMGNTNTATLAGVSFTDTLPDGLVVANPPGVSAFSCNAGTMTGTVTATAGSSTVSLSSGSLPAGTTTTCSFSVRVQGKVAGSYTNTSNRITATSSGANTSGGANVGYGQSSLTVVGAPVISKAFGANTLLTGNSTTLTFTIYNPNASTALTGVGFTAADNLGAQLQVASPNGLTGPTCTSGTLGGTITALEGSSSVNFTGGSINAGATCTFSLNVTATANSGLKTNSVTVTSSNGGTGNTSTANILIKNPVVDIRVSKAVGLSNSIDGTWSSNIVVPNSTPLYYRFVAENIGDVDFTSVTVNDPTLAAALGVSNPISCTWYRIDPADTVPPYSYITTTTLPAASASADPIAYCILGPVTATPGTVINTAFAHGVTASSASKDSATDSATYTVYQAPTVTKAFGAATIEAGGTTTLTLTLTNPNTTTALTAVQVDDTFPTGLTLADTTFTFTPAACGTITNTSGGASIAGDNNVRLSVTSLAVGASCQVDLNVTGSTLGVMNNVTGTVTAGGPVALTGGTANASLTVGLPPTISKVFGATDLASGGNTNLTVTIGNTNASAITVTNALTDTFPTGMTINTAGNTGTCTGVTAAAGAGSFTIANGTSIPAGGCTITVNITSSAVGGATNTIPAGALQTTAGNNASPATATLSVYIPPTVTKSFNPTNVAVGGTSVMTLTVTNPNTNPGALTGIQLPDTFPIGMTLANTTFTFTPAACGTVTKTSGGASAAGDNNARLNVASLAAGSSCQVNLNVTSSASGTSSNTTTAVTAAGPVALTGGTANANLGVISATKSVVGTSEDSTSGTNVAIGEIIRYRLVMELPEGTTTNLQILDNIVTNLRYINDGSTKVAFVCNSSASCATSSTAGIGSNPVISGNSAKVTPAFVLPAATITNNSGGATTNPFPSGDDPLFSLGNVTNSDSDVNNEYVVIEFNALIANLVANQDTNTRGNTFSVLVGGTTLSTSASVTVTIVEPSITTITKTGSFIADAGDLIGYQLFFANSGTAPAFDITVTDVLNSVLTTPVTVTGTTTGGACGSTASSVSGSYTAPNVTATVTCLNPGGTATINIAATVSSTALVGYTFTNSASLTYTSLPGSGTANGSGGNSTGSTIPGISGTSTGERNGSGGTNDYTAISNTVSATLGTPFVGKSVDPNALLAYAIGETIPYQIVITVPEGVTGNPTANLVDVIPAGLTYVPGSLAVTPEAGVTIGTVGPYTDANTSFFNLTGQTMTLTFGSITSTASGNVTIRGILVTFNVKVDNIVENQSGTQFNNSVDFTRTDPNNSAATVTLRSNVAGVSVIEPALNVSKVASTATPAYNSTLTYTLTVNHTGASSAPAYDAVITDTLPAGLTGLTNVNVTSTAPAGCATGVVNNSIPGTLKVTIGTIPLGCTVTITYDVLVSGAIDSTQTNSVNAAWTSQSGSVSGERTGVDGVGGALNDYAANTSQSVTITSPDLRLAKTNATTTVTAGGTTTYTLTLTNSGNIATTAPITIFDVLPTGLSIPDGAITAGGANPADWTCTAASNVITCTSSAAIAGSNGTSAFSFTVNVDATASGTVINKAQVGGGGDPTNPNPPTGITAGQCTGTNTPNEGCSTDSDAVDTQSITIIKDAVPNDPQDFSFTGSGPSGFTFDGGFSLDDDADATLTNTRTFNNLVPGNYSLTESNLIFLNWSLTSLVCIDPDSGSNTSLGIASIDLDAGEDITCTFTNTSQLIDLSLDKQVSNATPNVGSTLTFTLAVTNAGPNTATNIVVTDVIPSGYTYVAASITGGDSRNDTNPSTTGLTWTINSLPSGASVNLTYQVTVLATGTYDNYAEITSHTQADFDSIPGNGSTTEDDDDTQTVTPNPVVDVSLDKQVSNAAPNVGSTVTFTLVIANAGPSMVTNIHITDVVPSGYTYVPASIIGGDASNDTNPATTGLTWTINSLASGASVNLTYQVTVLASGTYDNYAEITGQTQTDSDSTPGNGSTTEDDDDTEAVTPVAVVDVSLDKQVNNTTPNVGSTITFTLVIANAGPSTATNVVVTDVIPNGYSYVAASITGGDTNNDTNPATSGLIWTINSLASGASVSLTYQVAVLASGTYDNYAEITSQTQTDSDSAPGNNSTTEDDDDIQTVIPTPIIDVSLDKQVSNAAPNVGSTVTFTLVLANAGPSTATNIIVTDVIPNGYTYVAASIAGGDASNDTSPTGTGLTWTINSLASGASVNLTYGATVLASGIYDNYAEITSHTQTDSDSTPGNGSTTEDDDDTQTISNALIGVSKRIVSRTEISSGTWDVTYEIRVENFGNVVLNSVQALDDLTTTFPSPATFTVQSVTSAAFTENPGYDGNIDADLLTGADSLAVGASATITLVVRVVPASTGPFSNIAIAGGQCSTCQTPVTDISQNGTDPDPDNDDDPTNNNVPTAVDFGPNLFDPPFGLKVLDASGLPVLQWTMVWINNSNIVAINAQVSDPIVAGTTFVPGSLTCTPSGVTTTTSCIYDSVANRIIWSGNLGPDLGATDAASAVNEITITFRVDVAVGITSVQNVATVDSDLNGNLLVTDPGEQQVASASARWTAPVSAPNSITLPRTGFAPNVVTDLRNVPHEAYLDTNGVTVEIPSLGVNIPIVGVPKKDGTWNVAWLGNQAGWLEGSAFPSWSGNSVLTGHVYNSNGLPGPFVNLNKLKYGDQIIIHAYGQNYIFEVRSAEVVEPNDKSVMKHEEKTWLTLVTCKDYDEKTNTYKKRVVVRAVLVKVTTR